MQAVFSTTKYAEPRYFPNDSAFLVQPVHAIQALHNADPAPFYLGKLGKVTASPHYQHRDDIIALQIRMHFEAGLIETSR